MAGGSRIVVSVCMLVSVLTLAASAPSSAGFFDFLFGGFRPPEPPAYRPRVDGEGPPGAGKHEPRISGGTGPAISYCVRLCDGRYFPVQGSSAAQATQLCSALCPATKTKVFFGAEIAKASARDGTQYENLANAFVYREKIVDGCTCNGHSPFGLATLAPSDDPTLRRGDLVATAKGLVKSSHPRAYGKASDRDLTSMLPSGIRGKEAREDAPRRHRRKYDQRNYFSLHDTIP